MNLLFDLEVCQPSASGKRHGGGKYGEVILLRMIERKKEFICFYNSDKWLNPIIEKACNDNSVTLIDIKEKTIEQIIEDYNIDQIYSCIPTKKILSIKNCIIVGTVHGLRDFETPTDKCFYQYKTNSLIYTCLFTLKSIIKRKYLSILYNRYNKRYLQNNNFRLITVSEHSYYAWLSYFPKAKDKHIKVLYSPNTSQNITVKKVKHEKYILLVSGNRWEKNNLRVIIAFDRLISNGNIRNLRLKVTGCDNANIFRYKIKNKEYFDFLGYVDDIELENLYANAYLFAYPSLNEGFGYPPMEAMKYGVPVISSPFSSMAEICASGALYFNPFSIEEIMNRILMMCDEKYRTEYSKKGKEQYERIKVRQDKDLDLLIDYITTLQE